MTDSYFRALLTEYPPSRDVIQAVVAGAAIPTPFWIYWLQYTNIVLATGTGLGAFIITWVAVYRIWKRSRP